MRTHLPHLSQPSRHEHRPFTWGGTLLALCALVLTTACTDRLDTSDDRWGRSGELIAMSGGEGGARYACATCHGVRGEGNGFDAPRLAGLPAGYLQKQMEDYATGLRPHEVMRDVARFLDSHERVRVANHYAALPPQALSPVTDETIAAAIQKTELRLQFLLLRDVRIDHQDRLRFVILPDQAPPRLHEKIAAILRRLRQFSVPLVVGHRLA